MARRILSAFVLAPLVVFPLLLASTQGIEVSGLGHKVLGGPDDDGDLEISVKVSVRNTTEVDQQVEVIVHAVDKEEYEVFEVRLVGKVKPGQTRTLTDTQFINEGRYKSILRWEVED